MNNRTYTSTQEGHEGQERAHATLFRAEGNRYDGSITQPGMGDMVENRHFGFTPQKS